MQLNNVGKLCHHFKQVENIEELKKKDYSLVFHHWDKLIDQAHICPSHLIYLPALVKMNPTLDWWTDANYPYLKRMVGRKIRKINPNNYLE